LTWDKSICLDVNYSVALFPPLSALCTGSYAFISLQAPCGEGDSFCFRRCECAQKVTLKGTGLKTETVAKKKQRNKNQFFSYSKSLKQGQQHSRFK
jgi:hypothetical protein